MSQGIAFLNPIVATVFTTVVAPVLVSAIVQELNAPARETANRPHVVSETREVVVGAGVGCTPEEAHRDAVRRAVLRVITTQAPMSMSASRSHAVCERVLTAPHTILLRDEQRQCRQEGPHCFREEVTVEVALDPLTALLRTEGTESQAGQRIPRQPQD